MKLDFGYFMPMKEALLIVDVQNDFCSGGSLAVPEAENIIPIINQLKQAIPLVVLTQDWHPDDHLSFASQHPGKNPGEVIDLAGLSQVLWPDHCIQNQTGSEFHSELRVAGTETIFQKGTQRELDSYSAFYDNAHRNSTHLKEFLTEKDVSRLFICGLATDYCVKFTVLDALNEGFDVIVIEDACRGVGLKEGDIANAKQQMSQAGAKLRESRTILRPHPPKEPFASEQRV